MDLAFTARSWTSPDGLTLHYRDYDRADGNALPALCLHGLTRNARDFEPLAAHLAPYRRLLVAEMRGRGRSEHARDHATYTPATYLDDIEALLAQLALDRFVAIGTSMGGLLTMMLAAKDAAAGRRRIAGAVLNDIGPDIAPGGLDRIRGYVGQARNYPSWMHAARALQDSSADIYPDYAIEDWIGFAKRTMALGPNGRIALDYDMAIAEPFAAAEENAAPPDLWPAFHALAESGPVTVLRGEHSDLLAPETLDTMDRAAGNVEVVTVPRVGHAPVLDEPEALAAIDRLLERAR